MTVLKMTAGLATTALLFAGCAVAPPMSEQEVQIKTDLQADRYLPASRQMRDAIETQEVFAQAAFWSNEYNINPGDLEAAIKLAASVRKLGNPNRAVEITQTTRALYPRDPYLIAEYAAALIASERAVDAMEPLNEGLAMTPAYGRLWSLKGAALDQQERYDEARQHYNRALQITPNDPNVLANIGFSYALSGDAPTAEQWLRRAAAMPGASPSVRQNLALVLQLQGKMEEAATLVAQTRAPQTFNTRSMPTPGPSQPAPTARQPQTRMTTNPQFASTSEAVRAMASTPQGQVRTSAPSAGNPASPEAQQAMLDRISRSLNTQPAPVQASPYATNLAPQTYPAAPVMAGGPVQTQTQVRREANRRRR